MRALIASGAGRYADPWHPFAAKSARLADVLREGGFDAEIDDDVDAAMRRLGDVDLLVVNAGDPWRTDGARAGADPASVDGLRQALRRGIGVLAVHTAVASLRDYPAWGAALGALWLPGLSYHPPRGPTRVEVTAAGLRSFELDDERYCRLQPVGDRTVVAWHEGDGSPEPAAWTVRHGCARIAVDVLGHDALSYEHTGHRALLTHLARWAVRIV
ncbi:MAG: ThuA domain-containing protein [Microbacterium sp.]